MRFRSTVELGGKTATGIEVPGSVVEKLGSGKRPAVTVKIGKHTYRTTVGPMGGRFLIPLSAENRTASAVEAGDSVNVEITLDTEPRVVTVPPDLAKALDRVRVARRNFDALSYSHQRRWVMSVDDAKTPETRQRRIEKAVSTLRDGGK